MTAEHVNQFLLQNQVFFIGVLGIVTFALSIYLGMLVKKLREQDKKKTTMLQEFQDQAQKQAEYYKESIVIIAKATISGDCETSEACLRIKKLLEYFPKISKEEEFEIIEKMFAELKDFSYLDDRKKLSKQEAYQQDKSRFQVEEKYKTDFVNSLEKLVTRFESMN